MPQTSTALLWEPGITPRGSIPSAEKVVRSPGIEPGYLPSQGSTLSFVLRARGGDDDGIIADLPQPGKRLGSVGPGVAAHADLDVGD